MAPKITLYTSYACPWAHRSQIALRELKLAFQTEIIDLKVPRTAEYLAINPRGLVPALVYNDEVLTESAIVSQFLVDAHPSHLEKTSSEPGAAKTLGDAIVKEIEPLLKDAGPFFGGSERLTLAEVDILLPPSFLPALEKDAPNFWKWANALTKEESVTYIWDEKKVTEGTITRLGLNKQ
ncbi:putative Glutathione S-transferase GST-6.0 [Glarea lozoyensis 74030]|uniref:Putative Glutathione S-transferase GST-6.0 n=1 Tax=Glarea lozoyensis (strain ATCC 74030 / MF5533) TaxID=1104152 RepID=H0EEK5_GLAL7|nr:putative Glutathione S-transferase GST-6.0 [Glarea lozoyensis 74030]